MIFYTFVNPRFLSRKPSACDVLSVFCRALHDGAHAGGGQRAATAKTGPPPRRRPHTQGRTSHCVHFPSVYLSVLCFKSVCLLVLNMYTFTSSPSSVSHPPPQSQARYCLTSLIELVYLCTFASALIYFSRPGTYVELERGVVQCGPGPRPRSRRRPCARAGASAATAAPISTR